MGVPLKIFIGHFQEQYLLIQLLRGCDMNNNLSMIGQRVAVIVGLAMLSIGLVGCTTTSRDYEADWSGGVGGSAVASSEQIGTGYGPNAYIRKRISDHFKVEGQGTFTRHTGVEYVEGSIDEGEIDATTSTLSLQYEFMPSNKDVRLFVGGGGAYTWFNNEDTADVPSVSNVEVDDQVSGLAEVGLTVPWGFHLKVSRFFEMKPEVQGTSGGSNFEGEMDDQDAWMFSAGINVPF